MVLKFANIDRPKPKVSLCEQIFKTARVTCRPLRNETEDKISVVVVVIKAIAEL